MTTSVAELSVKPIEVPEVKQYQNENTGNEENQYSNIAQGFEELHSSNQPNSNYYYGDDGSYQQIDSEQNQPYYTQDSQVYQDQYYYENGNNQTATVVEQQQYQQMVNYLLFICTLTFMKFNFRFVIPFIEFRNQITYIMKKIHNSQTILMKRNHSKHNIQPMNIQHIQIKQQTAAILMNLTMIKMISIITQMSQAKIIMRKMK